MPVAAGRLLGRARELVVLLEQLSASQLVALTGAAAEGAGKAPRPAGPLGRPPARASIAAVHGARQVPREALQHAFAELVRVRGLLLIDTVEGLTAANRVARNMAARRHRDRSGQPWPPPYQTACSLVRIW